jgi:hypothetical protein
MELGVDLGACYFFGIIVLAMWTLIIWISTTLTVLSLTLLVLLNGMPLGSMATPNTITNTLLVSLLRIWLIIIITINGSYLGTSTSLLAVMKNLGETL